MTAAYLQDELLRFVYAAMLYGTPRALWAVAMMLVVTGATVAIVGWVRGAARRKTGVARREMAAPPMPQRSSRSSFSAAANSLRSAS